MACFVTAASMVHRREHSQPLKLRAFLDFVVPRLELAIEEFASAFA